MQRLLERYLHFTTLQDTEPPESLSILRKATKVMGPLRRVRFTKFTKMLVTSPLRNESWWTTDYQGCVDRSPSVSAFVSCRSSLRHSGPSRTNTGGCCRRSHRVQRSRRVPLLNTRHARLAKHRLRRAMQCLTDTGEQTDVSACRSISGSSLEG